MCSPYGRNGSRILAVSMRRAAFIAAMATLGWAGIAGGAPTPMDRPTPQVAIFYYAWYGTPAVDGTLVYGIGALGDLAAVNVTTEHGTQWWLVGGKEEQRQRGRHASHVPTDPVLQPAADGSEVHSGFPPHRPKDLRILVDWIDDLGLRDAFPMVVLLEMAIDAGGMRRSAFFSNRTAPDDRSSR